MLVDLVAALMLLTRLPVGRFARTGAAADLARAVWAFPVVGLVVGLLGGAAYWLAFRLGLPAYLAAGWTLAVTLLATGAFHEDGLADVADGFGGGRTRERKLEIMRDSRIGAFGTLALIVSSLLRVGAIAAIAEPRRVMMALVVAGVLGRAGIIVLLRVLKPARADGIAATLSSVPLAPTLIGLLLGLAAPFACMPFGAATVTVVLAVAACLAVAAIADAHIGGFTGDILGAAAVSTEIVALTAMAGIMA